MAELDIVGLGIWGRSFSNWEAFCEGLSTGQWQNHTSLAPELIPAGNRRRVPKWAQMAIEVMNQACEMASMDPKEIATVFSSSMGDMQITDYLCRVLSTDPGSVSPTQFHNSVHNAAAGYWSMFTGSHAPANAVSAYSCTAPMAFLEAAIQVVEEGIPVLLVTQETQAPEALRVSCPSNEVFSAAMLLAPKNYHASPVCSVRFGVRDRPVIWPDLPTELKPGLHGNPGAGLVTFLAALAKHAAPLTINSTTDQDKSAVRSHLPLSPKLSLNLDLMPVIRATPG